MNCKKCGKEIAQGNKFCTGCGTKVELATPSNSLSKELDRVSAIEKTFDNTSSILETVSGKVEGAAGSGASDLAGGETTNTASSETNDTVDAETTNTASGETNETVDGETNGGSVIKKEKAKTILTPPKAPPTSSSSYEHTLMALTSNAPQNITLDDILTAKTGISKEVMGTISALRSIKNTWAGIFKKPSKNNIIVMIAGLIFAIVWVWTKYIPGAYSYMPPKGIASSFAFIFGTFNNVPTRILHFSAIMTLLGAFVPSILKGDIVKLIGEVKSTIAIIKKIISYKNSLVLPVSIMASGIGMFFANYMMRNCSFNKYFACLTLGTTILFSASSLFNSTFVKLAGGIFSDILKLFKVSSVVSKYKTSIQIGLGSGMILSFIACLIRSAIGFDNGAYLLGTVIFVLGIVFAIKPKAGASVGKAA